MTFDFLICSERSGSNLITKVLDGHPQVCGPFPTHMIRNFALNLFRYGDLDIDSHWETLLSDLQDLLAHRIGIWRTDFSAAMLRDLAPRTLEGAIRFVYQREAEAHGKSRIFVKENHACTYLPYLLSHFPEGRYVFFVRDPRDMALTWKKAGTAVGGVKAAAAVWRQDQRAGIEAYGFLKDLAKIHLTRFEDLLTEPEHTVRALCDFLILEYDPQMLEFHKKDIVQDNANRLSSWSDLQRPLIRDNFNLYKTELTPEEIQFVESVCREEMDFLGYPREYKDYPSLEELERGLPAESRTRNLNDGEQGIYPGFFAAVERISGRTLYGNGDES